MGGYPKAKSARRGRKVIWTEGHPGHCHVNRLPSPPKTIDTSSTRENRGTCHSTFDETWQKTIPAHRDQSSNRGEFPKDFFGADVSRRACHRPPPKAAQESQKLKHETHLTNEQPPHVSSATRRQDSEIADDPGEVTEKSSS